MQTTEQCYHGTVRFLRTLTYADQTSRQIYGSVSTKTYYTKPEPIRALYDLLGESADIIPTANGIVLYDYDGTISCIYTKITLD